MLLNKMNVLIEKVEKANNLLLFEKEIIDKTKKAKDLGW